jgi:alpha-L-rhamnosidase
MPSPFSQARWVWTQNPGDAGYAVRRFRTTLDITDTTHAVCHVSGDSRYVLYLDGTLIGRGPARSDLRHYVYETYPLILTTGRHTLAAIVVSYGKDIGPLAEMHDRGAFLLELRDSHGHVLSATGHGDMWRVQADTACTPNPVTRRDGYYSIGASECVDGTRLPHGWKQTDFDDSDWEMPHILRDAYLAERPMDLADPGGRWRLIPRTIPALREDAKGFQNATGAFSVAPHSRHEVIYEAAVYTIAYPVLTLEGGRDATVTLTYAEALTRDGLKGVRDERDGADVVGFSDVYKPGGGSETYSPLHWRAFRFIKLTIETMDSALTVRDLSYRETGYPWDRQAEFAVDDGPAVLPQVMDVDFRTLERCTAETFMDCPYYEQLQYVGDTRLQALMSYVVTGDTRLGEWAVRQFDWSRLPDGLTQSRYPSNMTQVIPPFSLLWVLMVEDLWRYAPGAERTVADCLTGCRGVLEWFGRHTNAEGLLDGELPWWNFVDWAEGFPNGVPAPAAAGLPCATLNLQYLAALQAYVRLHEGLGDTRESEYWQAEADMLADALVQTFWDPDSRLLREGPTDDWGFTQHAQAWGLLTGIIPADAIDDVVDSLHTDDTLTKTTYYHTFYVVEALAKVGRLERLWNHWLAPWRDALALHLTTWPEKPEPTRSDCHAWSAWPTYAFLTHVLGVTPVESGFRGYAINPNHVDGWDVLVGKVPTPAGLLSVSVAWLPDGNPRVAHGISMP